MAEAVVIWSSPSPQACPRFTLADGVNVKPGDPLYVNSSGTLALADANVASAQEVWFSLEHRRENDDENAATCAVAREVLVEDTDAPYTDQALQFLSATAGAITGTNPGAAGAAVIVLGKAYTTSLRYLSAYVNHVEVSAFLAGAAPATAGNYGGIYVADRSLRLVSCREVHRTAGSDGGAVTVNLEKLTTGTAQDSGVNMLSTTFSLKSTAATPVWLGPSATAADTILKPGDSIALKDAGVLTAVADVAVTAVFVDLI